MSTLSLRNILRENVENRLNITKIETLVEKVLADVKGAKDTKITELYSVLCTQRCALNAFPYTSFNIFEWQIMVGSVRATLDSLRGEALSLSTNEDCVRALIVALDESMLTT